MLAKIISAGALTLLLTGGALAYIPQPHNLYAGHSNSQQGAQIGQQIGQQYAANTAPYGFNDTQGSHALGVARVKWGGTLEVSTQGFGASELRSPFCLCPRRVTEPRAQGDQPRPRREAAGRPCRLTLDALEGEGHSQGERHLGSVRTLRAKACSFSLGWSVAV
jgi:hypothetical protein